MYKIIKRTLALTLAGCLFASQGFAATNGTISTDGKVTMFKEGQAVHQFTGKGLVDEEALLVCEGNCMLRVGGSTFTAQNNTAMAIKEDASGVSLYVKEGKVKFTVNNADKKIMLYSPYGLVTETDAFIFNATTENVARGYYSMEGSTAKIGMEEGRVILAMADGYKTVNENQSLQLAMSDVPAGTGAGAGASGGTGSIFGSGVFWAGLGVAAIVGTAVVVENNDDDDDDTAPAALSAPVTSSPSPTPSTPITRSPNR